MSSSSKQIIAVTGATGAQGGSVVRFLLADGGFKVRAITRNVDSEASKELKTKGVEVVKGDLNDIDGLTEAFKGAYGVFGLTNFWDPSVMSEDKEIAHGKTLVDAAKAAGVKHFIYSTLEKYPNVDHFNSKYHVNEYLIRSGLPRTSIYPGCYFENFLTKMKLEKKEDGSLAANWDLLKSDGPIPGYAVADTGAYAVAAFKDPKTWIGKDIKIIGEIFTPRQFVAALQEAAGVKVHLKEVDDASFAALKDVPQLKELHAGMRSFYETNGTMGRTPAEIEASRKLYPQQQTVKDFVKANVDKFVQ